LTHPPQANLLGGQIKPGEKPCPVVCWKPMRVKDKESGEERKIPFLRLHHVFNAAQCVGLKNLPPANRNLERFKKYCSRAVS